MGYAKGRLDIDLTPERAAVIFKQSLLVSDWPHDTWLMWLKNRIHESPGFPIGCHAADMQVVTATMHVFFLWIEETPEMLKRLRNEKRTTEGRESRSKLRSYTAQIKPINAVAARVAHPPRKDER